MFRKRFPNFIQFLRVFIRADGCLLYTSLSSGFAADAEKITEITDALTTLYADSAVAANPGKNKMCIRDRGTVPLYEF